VRIPPPHACVLLDPRRNLRIGLKLLVAIALVPAVGAHGAPSPCAGRYVVTRASGDLVRAADDTIVLDVAGAIVDPACGAAAVRARVTRGRWRFVGRWRGCRGHKTLTLRVRTSADCTVVRGTVSAPGARPSRLVATASRCGDGIRDAGRGERCDDANLADDDGCDAACGRCVDPATLASTWAAVQANVFDRACTACHGAQTTAGLDLRAPGSYAAIVDVPAASGLFQVKPGDRRQSLIWLKMAKTALGGLDELPGGGMPFGFPLPADVVQAFGSWIDAGAPGDGYVAGAEALLVPCAGANIGASTVPATPAKRSGRNVTATGMSIRNASCAQSTTNVASRTAGSSSMATSPVTNGTRSASCGMNGRCTMDHEKSRPRPETRVHRSVLPPQKRHAPSGYQT